MQLKDKTIVLISSETWGDIYISKHNYAIALARRGNKVYFLNPVRGKMKRGAIEIAPSGVHPNLMVISYNTFFPVKLKFHTPKIFDYLMRMQIKKIVQKMGVQPDVVWDFNCSYLYNRLDHFGAPVCLFHPVDMINKEVGNKYCDMVISVSQAILDQYKRPKVPKYLINHGLAEPFARLAKQEPVESETADRSIRLGYVGNIMMNAVDREIMQEVIAANDTVEFHMIGPYTYSNNNIADERYHDKSYADFLAFMKMQDNVKFYGPLNQREIARIIDNLDMFFLCYRETPSYRADNSHKVLEYLSTGKVVVSNHLSFYQDKELLEMTPFGKNHELPKLVQHVAENLHYYNSLENQQARKQWALDHTYERHIQRIEEYIYQPEVLQKRSRPVIINA